MEATNYIHSKALRHCHSQQLLFDIQAEYGDVLYRNNMRWVRRGSPLQRFYSLRGEIGECLAKNRTTDARTLWSYLVGWFVFLVDMPRHLNVLNRSLQGQDAEEANCTHKSTPLGPSRNFSEGPSVPPLLAIMTSFPQNISARTKRHAADSSQRCCAGAAAVVWWGVVVGTNIALVSTVRPVG